MAVELKDDNMCFCCGSANPIGLKLEFEATPGKGMRTVWTPRREHQGFRDIVHGGLVATVLDEVMIRLLWGLGIPAMTADLQTRLLRPLQAGKTYRFEARLVSDRGRVLNTEAEGFDVATGERVAWGAAKCVGAGESSHRRERG